MTVPIHRMLPMMMNFRNPTQQLTVTYWQTRKCTSAIIAHKLSLQVLGSTKGQSHPVGNYSSTQGLSRDYNWKTLSGSFVAIALMPSLDRARGV